jgi:hypothetical protein
MKTRRTELTTGNTSATPMQTTIEPTNEVLNEPPKNVANFVIVKFADGFLSERISTKKEINSGRLKFISNTKVLVKVKEETFEGVIVVSGGKIFFGSYISEI